MMYDKIHGMSKSIIVPMNLIVKPRLIVNKNGFKYMNIFFIIFPPL